MSNGGGVIIICGTGGMPVTDKTIVVYDAPVSIAIKLDKDAMIAELETDGDSHAVATRKVNQFVNEVERDYWRWGELSERLGLPYERHEPHAQP